MKTDRMIEIQTQMIQIQCISIIRDVLIVSTNHINVWYSQFLLTAVHETSQETNSSLVVRCKC